MLLEYKGTVEQIFYKSNDFLIARFKTEDNNNIKIIGEICGVSTGNQLNIKGNWENHFKFGKQFKVTEWKKAMPNTVDSAVEFLSSGLIKGVGKKRAKQIVQALGKNAISIINTHGADALKGIKGIGKRTRNLISESIKANYEVQEIITELKKYDISTSVILKLYEKYQSNTVLKVKENPYRMTNIYGMGFFKVDEIAQKMGIPAISGYRISSCISYTLNTLCKQGGHTFINESELIDKTKYNLNKNRDQSEYIDKDQIQQTIYSLDDKLLIAEKNRVYPKRLFEYEDSIAQRFSILKSSRDGEAMPKIKNLLKKYQKRNKIILEKEQRFAIETIMKENMMILTGNPGTGKTTVVRAILDIYRQINEYSSIRLCAPTGRASKKLQEATGFEATTIHRLIGYKKGESPEYHANNRLIADFVIVDEFSMADLEITHLLLDALPRKAKILFIGDTDQLQSVGAGNVLHDIIASGVPVVKLTEIFRQAEESQIITNAHRINNGEHLLIDQTKEDFYFINQPNVNAIQQLIVKSAERFIELGFTLEDILILSPMYKGEVGVTILNERLRDRLNPCDKDKKELKVGSRLFREGDKVIQNVNNTDKDVYNGEMGIVKSITKEKNKNGNLVDILICEFDGSLVKYEKQELIEIDLGYCITIHKSQGGEAPIVIMPITMQHQIMLARNLYYTGITRAKDKVVLIGTMEAMNTAIQNNRVTKRNSTLDKRINSYKKLSSETVEIS